MYKLFRRICYPVFCVIIFVPTAIIFFILGGTDAVLGTDLHEKFIDLAASILDKVKYD
jgi:hypothetical protein